MCSDLAVKIHPEPIEHFESLPDPVLLSIFNRIGDVKALGRCGVVSKRFHALIPQVDTVIVRVDCVISDEDPATSAATSCDGAGKPRHPISSIFRFFFSGLLKPLQTLTQLINPSPRRIPSIAEELGLETVQNGVTHHSPTQVLKNFNEIRLLKIELPSGELGTDEGVLLKWKASFGSTLDHCVILGASSVIHKSNSNNHLDYFNGDNTVSENDNGSTPESFYTNGGLKLRVVWTISSLIAASARHYLLQPIISAHKTLDSLILTDSEGQGVLSMSKDQLEELRVKPLSASSSSKRTLVPALNMRLWYAPQLELANGMVLKGATLVAIKPSETKKEVAMGLEGNLIGSAFEEPFASAARMLLKRRTYCLEMNSF